MIYTTERLGLVLDIQKRVDTRVRRGFSRFGLRLLGRLCGYASNGTNKLTITYRISNSDNTLLRIPLDILVLLIHIT
jgi:hypothetical protein